MKSAIYREPVLLSTTFRYKNVTSYQYRTTTRVEQKKTCLRKIGFRAFICITFLHLFRTTCSAETPEANAPQQDLPLPASINQNSRRQRLRTPENSRGQRVSSTQQDLPLSPSVKQNSETPELLSQPASDQHSHDDAAPPAILIPAPFLLPPPPLPMLLPQPPHMLALRPGPPPIPAPVPASSARSRTVVWPPTRTPRTVAVAVVVLAPRPPDSPRPLARPPPAHSPVPVVLEVVGEAADARGHAAGVSAAGAGVRGGRQGGRVEPAGVGVEVDRFFAHGCGFVGVGMGAVGGVLADVGAGEGLLGVVVGSRGCGLGGLWGFGVDFGGCPVISGVCGMVVGWTGDGKIGREQAGRERASKGNLYSRKREGISLGRCPQRRSEIFLYHPLLREAGSLYGGSEIMHCLFCSLRFFFEHTTRGQRRGAL